MGRGNACVRNKYEGLYYIDNDNIDWYWNSETEEAKMLGELSYSELSQPEWKFDELQTQMKWEDIKCYFTDRMRERFKSLFRCDQWIDRGEHAILENGLFYIVIEDNEWSMAVKLIQKESDYYNVNLEPLQKRHHQNYLAAMRDILFEMFDTLGVYGGPWTSGTIRREDYI